MHTTPVPQDVPQDVPQVVEKLHSQEQVRGKTSPGAVERFENASRRIPALREKALLVTRDSLHNTTRNTARESVLKTQICMEADRDRRQCAGCVAELRLYFSFGVCAVYRSTAPGPLGYCLLYTTCCTYHEATVTRCIQKVETRRGTSRSAERYTMEHSGVSRIGVSSPGKGEDPPYELGVTRLAELIRGESQVRGAPSLHSTPATRPLHS